MQVSLPCASSLPRASSNGENFHVPFARIDHIFGDIELVFGDLSDGSVLNQLMRTIRPDVVCCPDPTAVFFGDGYFNHRDHRITGWAALDAVAPAAGNPHYFPELRAEGLDVHSVSLVYLSGTLEPNAWIDITATLERKIEGLFCHASQLVETGDWFREFLRDAAEVAGRSAGVTYAEAFRRIAVS